MSGHWKDGRQDSIDQNKNLMLHSIDKNNFNTLYRQKATDKSLNVNKDY
jgi:hypothetical protein